MNALICGSDMTRNTTLQDYIFNEVLLPQHRDVHGSVDIVPMAYRLILGWMHGSHEDAEEILADTVMEFSSAYRRATERETVQSPRALFIRIAQRRCIDFVRRVRSRPKMTSLDNTTVDIADQNDESVESGYETVVRNEIRHTVRQAVMKLVEETENDIHRNVIILRYQDGVESASEIATRLSITSSNVRVILLRARARLAIALENSPLRPTFQRELGGSS